ncbi:MAG TPA: hypothetical protein VHO69_11995 [Phototrophicaceae bacterium]|nr:hypothetical protein [Phototrophicaceae bacterium]
MGEVKQGERRGCISLAFGLVTRDWTPHPVYTKYRRRFGIEAPYRLLRPVKILTNSRNPALRFCFLGWVC